MQQCQILIIIFISYSSPKAAPSVEVGKSHVPYGTTPAQLIIFISYLFPKATPSV